MDFNRVLVFKSIDAKEQNPSNKPGNFTTKFIPELILDDNKTYYLALDHGNFTHRGIILDQNIKTIN